MEDRSNLVDRRSEEVPQDVEGNVAINPPAVPVRIRSTGSLPSWPHDHPDALVGAGRGGRVRGGPEPSASSAEELAYS
jgi:hypothetical protein